MAVEVKVPTMGESVYEVQISHWLKQEGDRVEKDDDLVEIESEKATVTVPSPTGGALVKVLKRDGEFVGVGEVIAQLDESATGQPAAPAGPGSAETASVATTREKPAQEPVERGNGAARVMPAAQRLLDQYGLSAEDVAATGPGGRLLKEDVLRHIEQNGLNPARVEPAGAVSQTAEVAPVEEEPTVAEPPAVGREEEIVPMSMIRRAIAQRLVEAQQAAALLTTFNEVDLSEVIALRKKHGERFQERYGVKLGFMSFFVKAAIEGLRRFPQVNAEIRDRNVVYHHYYDIGVAIGGGKGLVVPVLRNAEGMSFAEIERAIADMAVRARQNRLLPEELEGGTFSISNGGVYGSMLSTPIVNPPQSGILGLHAIQDRVVAREGQVVIRPMMYLALTYDHRIVDGREAVAFLRTIKDVVEDPARLFLEI
jgi:2-oxoglutarate dehydrogenase E2 component (dihydrolipoamide succinyltransferase)